jgi:hypothetical protein
MDTLSSERYKKRGIFDVKATDQLILEHMSGKQDHHLLLYGVLLVELWHREYMDEN